MIPFFSAGSCGEPTATMNFNPAPRPHKRPQNPQKTSQLHLHVSKELWPSGFDCRPETDGVLGSFQTCSKRIPAHERSPRSEAGLRTTADGEGVSNLINHAVKRGTKEKTKPPAARGIGANHGAANHVLKKLTGRRSLPTAIAANPNVQNGIVTPAINTSRRPACSLNGH